MAKILVADDDSSLLELYEAIFTKHGFEVKVVLNGLEALNAVKESHYDVLLSDIKMPVMDGVELLAEIRKLDPDIPIVVLVSGYSEFSESDLMQKGANAFLAKPLKGSELIHKVNELLKLKKKLKYSLE